MNLGINVIVFFLLLVVIMKNFLLVLICVFGFGQVLAQTVTVGFEGIAAAGTQVTTFNPYTEGGFNFHHLDGGSNIIPEFRVLSATFGGITFAGSDMGYVQAPSIFRISTGSPFDLSAIQLGGVFASSGNVTITGTLAAGGTLTQSATIAADAYTAVTFPATWTGLSQVDFEYSSNFLAIDNVVLTITAVVPAVAVPSLSVWMVFVLFVLLGLLAFRKLNLQS